MGKLYLYLYKPFENTAKEMGRRGMAQLEIDPVKRVN